MTIVLPLLRVPALSALVLASAFAAESEGPLALINPDFSNLEGLSALQQPGWYSGVPEGWSAAPPPENPGDFFAVHNMGAAGFVANLRVLSRLKPEFQAFRQEVGVLAERSDITLTFDVTTLRDGAFSMGAAIVNARGGGVDPVLAKANFQAAGAQSLTATNVPRGTWVMIQFWAVEGFPGIGNVGIKAAYSP